MPDNTDNVIPIQPQDWFEEAFWPLYPRRVSKKDARRAWARLAAAQQLKAITVLPDWRIAWAQEGRDLSRIPYPASWLNGECFEDELPQKQWHKPAAHALFKPEQQPERSDQIPPAALAAIAKLKARR